MLTKKFFILTAILITFLSLTAMSCPQYSNDDNNTRYEIQRGETLDDIAKRYGTTESELKKLNPNITIFYTGIEINIPTRVVSVKPLANSSKTNTNSSNKALLSCYKSEVERADKLLGWKEYKKANKSYTEIIKKYSSFFKCGDAYYGRALASYNRKKWKDAIRDFNTAIKDKELDSSSRDHCKELLAKARRNREEQLERRGEMWAGIIQVGLSTTANVMAMHEAEKQQKASAKGGSSSFNLPPSNTSYSTSNYCDGNIAQQMSQPGYFNKINQELISASITQVQQQEMDEYNQARQGALAMGKDLTLDEWRCQKGAAIMALKEQGIDIIAEQQELSRENSRKWKESLAQESDERLQRIKDQYATKYGTTTSSYSKSSSTPKNSYSSTSSYRGSSSSQNKNVSTTKNETSYSQSGLSNNTNNNSHQQFKNGNKNVNSSDYTYKHRVTLYQQDGSNFKAAKQDAELYEKGANEYIKIGDTFFPAQSPQKVTKYRKRIVYGGVGLYYN